MTHASTQRLRPFKPQRFGRYTLLMPISSGGMGEVFLARLEGPHGFDKLCVIKQILPALAEDHDFTERFVNEARVLVKLAHGNIAHVLDMGVHEGSPFIALEFIDGKDLRRVLGRMRERQLPVPLSFVLFVMVRVLDALAYAHRKVDDDENELNLVHRDVSPQNVLISYEGEVKVIDFGLAKSTLSNAKTNPGIVLGKFRYMSPEQARHQPVDRRSDLYAVGLCLYELISGTSPFAGVPAHDLMMAVGKPAIAPLHSVEPACPMPLSDAVMKALAIDPDERWQSAEELRARLQVILNELDPAASSEAASRFMRDTFSAEYTSERKMLTALKAQAKELEEAPEADELAEASAPDQLREVKTELNLALSPLPSSPRAEAPTPTASSAVAPQSEVEAEAEQPPMAYEALSFQPTKKSASAVKRAAVKAALAEDDGRSLTQTTISIAPSEPESRKRRNSGPAAREDEPTSHSVPSVVLDGVSALSDQTELEHTPPPAQAAAPAHTSGRLTPGAGSAHAKKRPAPPPRAPRAQSGPRKMAVRTDRPSALTVAKRLKGTRTALIWLLLPAVAVLGVASYILWDLYAQASAAQANEAAELRLKQLSSASRALTALKADYAKIPVGVDQRRLQTKLSILSEKAARQGDDPAVLRSVAALHAEVRAALEKTP